MKLQKLWALLKASKIITKWQGSDAEWLCNGYASYPIYGLPSLSEDTLRTMLDIAEDKWMSYHYKEEGELPFSNQDNFRDDEELRLSQVTFTVHGVEYLALTKGLDIYLLRKSYLRPLDIKEGLMFYLRSDLVAIKEGMLLRAVIVPEIITDDMALAEIMSIATKLHGAARVRKCEELSENLLQHDLDGQQTFEEAEDHDG